MTYETILYEVTDRVATITFNRPDQLERDQPADGPRAPRGLRRGRGRRRRLDDRGHRATAARSAPAPTSARSPTTAGSSTTSPTCRTYAQWEAPQEATPPFRTMTKPVITAVNGICCGAGLDLVTTGDIAIASERATFFDPHVSIGLVSGREMVRLARVLPINVAMRMALVGKHERLSAQRAYELGLITEVVEHDKLLERAREIAALVNRNAPLAVRGTRLAIRKGLDLPLHEAEILAEAFRERVVRTDDAKEGPRGLHGEAHARSGGASDASDLRDHPSTRSVRRPGRHDHAEPARGAQRLRPPDVRGDARRLGAGSRPTRRSTPSCCGPRATGRSAPGSTSSKPYGQPDDVWNHEDPGELLSPKWQKVWKPVVCAVQGICTAGAFYFVNEADIVICSTTPRSSTRT